MSDERPDAWVIIEVVAPSIGTIRRLLCSYYGGYLGADSWRMSSGVVSTESVDNYYNVTNHSGSVYTIAKGPGCYRMSGLASGVWANTLKAAENSEDVKVRLYDYEEAISYLESVRV